MKMKNLRIYLYCSLLAIVGLLQAQVRMERDYDEAFPIVPGQRVEITNKYGEVIVRTWADDQVRIVVKVAAEGKNQETVNKAMSRVQVRLRKVGEVVSGDTEIESTTGTFSLLGDVEDYSKALFGKQRLTINYEIWLPENVDLSINNKYGNIFLASLTGNVNVNLAHGDLKANRLDGRLDYEHAFGKSTFGYVNRGRLVLRGVNLTLDEGHSFSVQSSSSEVRLNKLHFARIDSRNDRLYVTDINELLGTGRFTDLQAERVFRTVDLSFNFGEVSLSQIDARFKSINLIGKSTDFNLTLNQASYINARIKGPEEKMVVPNSMMALSRFYDPETRIVELTGLVGYTNDFVSQLNLDAEGGNVIISLRETPIFTDRR